MMMIPLELHQFLSTKDDVFGYALIFKSINVTGILCSQQSEKIDTTYQMRRTTPYFCEESSHAIIRKL